MTDDELQYAMELLPSDEARAEVAAQMAASAGAARWFLVLAFVGAVIAGPLFLVSHALLRSAGLSTQSWTARVVHFICGLTSAAASVWITNRLQIRRQIALWSAALRRHGVVACASCGYIDRVAEGAAGRRCSECGAELGNVGEIGEAASRGGGM